MITYRDVSHYDYEAGTRNLVGEPLVIAKATQGTGFRDPRYSYWRDHCRTNGIPFGAYHWIDTADLQRQAANAFGAVGPGVPLMVDAEADGATVPRILEFVQRYRALGGLVTLVYLPRWWWSGHIGSPDLRPLAAAGLALVSSDYNTTPPSGWDPYGGVTPAIWQYTSTPHDRNRFDGTTDELIALVFNHREEPMAEWGEEGHSNAEIWRVEALMSGSETVRGGVVEGEPVWLVSAIKELLARPSVVVDQAQLEAAVRAAVAAEIATIREQVADEIRDRMAE